jgi:hypothetical protein
MTLSSRGFPLLPTYVLGLYKGGIYMSFIDARMVKDADGVKMSEKIGILSNNRIYVANYPRQGSETDDTARLQRALNALTNGSTLVFELNKSYTISSPLNIPASLQNITFEGNNATLISNLPVNNNGANGDATQFTILKDTINQIKSGIIPTVNITQGDTTITFNSADISGVQVGDVVVINTSKNLYSTNSVYKAGSLRFVKSVSSTQLTLDDEIETSLNISVDNVTVSIYRPVNNVFIKNLNVQLANNGFQGGIWFRYVNGLTVKDCRFIGGGQQFWGINANGFNIRIENVTCNEFLDNSLSFGYGVIVSGHNIRVNKGTFYRCKHGIAAGASSFINTDIGYYHNYATDPQLSAFDAHGSCQQVKMINNVVVNAGKSWAACGLWARGNNFEIIGNTIRAAKNKTNSVSGIKVIECATNGITISGNKIYDCDYGLKIDEMSQPLYDFEITENQMFNILSYGIIVLKLYDSVISKNRITSRAMGIFFQGVSNTDIEGNIIKYASNSWGGGIYLESYASGDSNSYTGISIRGNHITAMSSNATNPIRVRNGGYDLLTIVNNIIDTSLGGGSPISLSECTTLTKWIRERNIGDYIYTSLPSATAYDRGRTIIVQGGAGAADKVYICMKTASDTYTWVQIATG